MCIVVMASVEHFIKGDLQKLIDAIRADNPQALLKMKAEFACGTIERMFLAVKKPPTEWLSVDDIPGTPENAERMAWAKAVFKKASSGKTSSRESL